MHQRVNIGEWVRHQAALYSVFLIALFLLASRAAAQSHPPVITGFTPHNGPVGTNVVIHGSHFTGATAVKFHGVSADFTVHSAGAEIVTSVPAGATTGTITVTTPVATAHSPITFTVTHSSGAPTIRGFTPTRGPVGTAVTIQGSSFLGTSAVTFNGVPATFTVHSATQIAATVPHHATSGHIRVTNAHGTAVSVGNFTVTHENTPLVAGFVPSAGAVGSQVVILGREFTGATAVRFGGVTATAFSVNASGTRITATVPAGALSGHISVTTPGGSGTRALSFMVAPRINILSSHAGHPGDHITIAGANFSGVTAVLFNEAAASFVVHSPTRITVTVPEDATTGPISVTNAGGTVVGTTAFTVSPNPH